MSNDITDIITPGIIISVIIILGVITCIVLLNEENKSFNKYVEFCEERPNFCYCTTFQCEWKTSETCINGVCNKSKDTQDLCDLATKLKDKEMIFKAC